VYLASRADRRVRQWCELGRHLHDGCTMHRMGERLWPAEVPPAVLAIDLGQPGRWDVWLRGVTQADRAQNNPGANGIKIRQGWRGSASQDADYWSACRSNRMAPPALSQLRAGHVCADDFAFGMSGFALYHHGSRHTARSHRPPQALAHLAAPNGMVGKHGRPLAEARRREGALCQTDGGFLIPHDSGIQDAKLVRMEVGESGSPLLQGV